MQAVLRFASERRVGVIPFGLGSGVVGGVIASPKAILLDLGAMDAVRFIDPTSTCWPASTPATTASRLSRPWPVASA